MIKLLKQLFIERLLSGAIPYIAFHPELGVPVGVFNYKDEPDHQSRVRSIKRYGTKGNPLSYDLARKLGVTNPIPSYSNQSDADDICKGGTPPTRPFDRGGETFVCSGGLAAKVNTRGAGMGTGKAMSFLGEMAQVRTPRGRMDAGEMQKMVVLMKKGALSASEMKDNMAIILELAALEDTLRLGISQKLGMSNEQLFQTIDNMNEGGVEMAKFGITADQFI